MRDYPAEDNRSEITGDSLDNPSEKSTKKENKVEHLTSKEVENLGIALTTQTKSDSDLQVLYSPVEVGEDILNKKIFEDTKAILNEETENDNSQDFVGTNTEKTIAPTELIEETRRLLNEVTDTMEIENKQDDELSSKKSENVHNDKQETTEADLEGSKTIESFKIDLKKLQEVWSNLNELDDDIFDLDDVSNTTSSDKSEVDHIIASEEKNKEQQIGSISEVPSDSYLIDKITNSSPSFFYQDDALLATESDTATSDKPDKNINEEEIKVINDKIELENRKLITNEFGMTSDKVEYKEGDIKDLSSDNHTSEITKNDIRNAQKIWLTVDNPTVVTSPGFPRPYPTNTTTDWMISGDGMGIELNITNFAVNGHVGDYLLIKPGKNNSHLLLSTSIYITFKQ